MTGQKANILILRHAQGATRSRQRLEKLGKEVTRLCLSKIEYLVTPFPEADYDGVILTSARAPNIMKNHPEFTTLSNLPVFCVGAHTANQADKVGFSQIADQGKDAASLAQTLVKSGNCKNILYPCAKDISFDFHGFLSKHDINCQNWPIYSNTLHAPTTDEIIRGLTNTYAVFLHSKRIAVYFFELLEKTGQNGQDLLRDHKIIAISSNVASVVPAKLRASTHISSEKSEQSMVECLESIINQ